MERFTPLRMWAAASPEPRMRWRLLARRRAAPGPAAEPSGSRFRWRVVALVGATDYLDRVIRRCASRGIHRSKKNDDHRADERLNVLVRVLAHQQAFGLD